MPYRSGMFQAALGAITVVAFLIGNSSGGKSREKRMTGRIERTGDQSFRLVDEKSREHQFQMTEGAEVFFNEKAIAFDSIENGRQAAVRFTKAKKGVLFARAVDVFPTHADFEQSL